MLASKIVGTLLSVGHVGYPGYNGTKVMAVITRWGLSMLTRIGLPSSAPSLLPLCDHCTFAAQYGEGGHSQSYHQYEKVYRDGTTTRKPFCRPLAQFSEELGQIGD